MLYVYAVTEAAPPRPGRGLLGERLRVVRARGLQTIVGEIDTRPTPTPDVLAGHDGVVRRLARGAPALLPARFGWTVADERALRASLGAHRGELAASLRDVRGCVQMTLRLFGTTRGSGAAARRARRRPATRGPRRGTRYLEARARARQEAESLPELDPLRTLLQGLIRDERRERHDAGGLIGTAYHLVERRWLRTYQSRVEAGAATLAPLRLHLSGPWAPYAFGPRVLA
jgi:hypothetical protein